MSFKNTNVPFRDTRSRFQDTRPRIKETRPATRPWFHDTRPSFENTGVPFQDNCPWAPFQDTAMPSFQDTRPSFQNPRLPFQDTRIQKDETFHKHSCPFCEYVFPHLGALRNHLCGCELARKVHYRCKKCGKRSASTEHLLKCNGLFRCSSCIAEFTSKKALRNHQGIAKAKRCKICDKQVYLTKCEFACHQSTCRVSQREHLGGQSSNLMGPASMTHHDHHAWGFPPETFESGPCRKCGLEFPSEKHIRTCGVKKKKNYQCNSCKRDFTKTRLRNHQMRSVKPLKCKKCGKQFLNMSKCELVGHRRECRLIGSKGSSGRSESKHVVEMGPQCEFCGKSFTVGYLGIHQELCDGPENMEGLANDCDNTHVGARRFDCEFCGKSFRIFGNLKRHIKRVHTGKTPFKCLVCCVEFLSDDALAKHKSIHTDEKPLKCFDCGVKFSKTENCESHKCIGTGEETFEKRSILDESGRSAVDGARKCLPSEGSSTTSHCHTKPETSQTKTKGIKKGASKRKRNPHECTICEKRFAGEWKLYNHELLHKQNRERERHMKYNCKRCRKKFANECHLERHMKNSCEQCNKCFQRRKHLEKHILTHALISGPVVKESEGDHGKEGTPWWLLKSIDQNSGSVSKIFSSKEETSAAEPPLAGPSLDGPPLDGPPLDGPPLAKPSLDGPPLAGPSLVGPPLAGPPLDGPNLAGPHLAGPHLAGPPLALPPLAGPSLDRPPLAGPSLDRPPLAGPSLDGPPLDPPMQESDSQKQVK